MVHIEKQPLKFSEKKKDADEKSYLNLEFLNVLCTKNLYWILLCHKFCKLWIFFVWPFVNVHKRSQNIVVNFWSSIFWLNLDLDITFYDVELVVLVAFVGLWHGVHGLGCFLPVQNNRL